MAISRLLSNERKMLRCGKLDDFKSEVLLYRELDHAETIPDDEIDNLGYYMPVHGVIKESSTTTKTRPVCDCSGKSSTGYSVIDCLLPGPNLYPAISDILLVFRLHNIAFSVDISKMFREINLLKQERDFHRFLARDASGKILEMRMTRVTFGARPSHIYSHCCSQTPC